MDVRGSKHFPQARSRHTGAPWQAVTLPCTLIIFRLSRSADTLIALAKTLAGSQPFSLTNFLIRVSRPLRYSDNPLYADLPFSLLGPNALVRISCCCLSDISTLSEETVTAKKNIVADTFILDEVQTQLRNSVVSCHLIIDLTLHVLSVHQPPELSTWTSLLAKEDLRSREDTVKQSEDHKENQIIFDTWQ